MSSSSKRPSTPPAKRNDARLGLVTVALIVAADFILVACLFACAAILRPGDPAGFDAQLNASLPRAGLPIFIAFALSVAGAFGARRYRRTELLLALLTPVALALALGSLVWPANVVAFGAATALPIVGLAALTVQGIAAAIWRLFAITTWPAMLLSMATASLAAGAWVAVMVLYT